MKKAFLILMGLLFVQPTFGENGNKNEIARQMFESIFTPPGSLPVQDLIAEGEEFEAEGAAGHLSLTYRGKFFFKAPNLLRFDRVAEKGKKPLSGVLQVMVRDGDSFYIFAGENTPSKAGIDPQVAPETLPFPLTRYRKDASREFYYLGQETWQDRQVHRVQILNPADPNWTAVIWIDHERRLPIQIEYPSVLAGKDGKPGKRRVVWSDFRQLQDGRYFPHQTQIFSEDKLVQMKVYKGVRVNVGLDPSLFKPIPELEK